MIFIINLHIFNEELLLKIIDGNFIKIIFKLDL